MGLRCTLVSTCVCLLSSWVPELKKGERGRENSLSNLRSLYRELKMLVTLVMT